MKNSYRKYMLKPDFIGSNRGGCQLSGSVLAGAGDSTFSPVSLWGAGRDRKVDYNRKLIRSKRCARAPGAHAPRVQVLTLLFSTRGACAPNQLFQILEDLGHFEDFGELAGPEPDPFDIQIFMNFHY